MPMNATLEVRIKRGIEISREGCWLWRRRSCNPDGYGTITFHKKRWLVHRLVYTFFVGAIKEDVTLDHLCHTRDLSCPGGVLCEHRRCCNPEHQEPVTQSINLSRGRHPNMILHSEHVCSEGHSVTGDNIRLRSDGREKCRTCDNKRARDRRGNAAIARPSPDRPR
jgi:hypothetical protein